MGEPIDGPESPSSTQDAHASGEDSRESGRRHRRGARSPGRIQSRS